VRTLALIQGFQLFGRPAEPLTQTPSNRNPARGPGQDPAVNLLRGPSPDPGGDSIQLRPHQVQRPGDRHSGLRSEEINMASFTSGSPTPAFWELTWAGCTNWIPRTRPTEYRDVVQETSLRLDALCEHQPVQPTPPFEVHAFKTAAVTAAGVFQVERGGQRGQRLRSLFPAPDQGLRAASGSSARRCD